jgi:Kef-type K+ transport system membrane component KefB
MAKPREPTEPVAGQSKSQIVGAFAAGLALDEARFESFRDRGEHRLDELLQPVSALLAPIFFCLFAGQISGI